MRQEGDAGGSLILEWHITRPPAALIRHVIDGAIAISNAYSTNPTLPAAYPAHRSHLNLTTLSCNDYQLLGITKLKDLSLQQRKTALIIEMEGLFDRKAESRVTCIPNAFLSWAGVLESFTNPCSGMHCI
jgi:hypothetical protein